MGAVSLLLIDPDCHDCRKLFKSDTAFEPIYSRRQKRAQPVFVTGYDGGLEGLQHKRSDTLD